MPARDLDGRAVAELLPVGGDHSSTLGTKPGVWRPDGGGTGYGNAAAGLEYDGLG